jgi:hypothetical protein
MKNHTIWLLSLSLCLCIFACGHPKFDYSAMHTYTPEQLLILIDNAYKIEPAGSPVIERSENPADSSFTIRSTQMYRVYVNVTGDNHLDPKPDGGEVKELKPGGPIIITNTCDMTCTPVKPGDSCNVSGCEQTSKCGCSQGSCGNNCTTDIACHQWTSGFSFGKAIIF